MFGKLFVLAVITLWFTGSQSASDSLIFFNNEDNGINYEWLDSEGSDRVITAENSTQLYQTKFKIKSMDYDLDDQYMVWSSNEYPYFIYLVHYKTSDSSGRPTKLRVTRRSIVAQKNSQTKVAIDWVHNLVYYFNYRTLRVAHADTPEVSYDLTGKTDADDKWKYSSSNIAVNPLEAFIVWTEYNSIDGLAIMRKCRSDGSDQKILVYEDIRLPVCVAIDFETKSILWIDNELHSLSSVDYEGNNRKTLKLSKELFSDCSSVDIFNGSIYWSAPKENKVLRLNIRSNNLDNENATTIVESDMDIDFVRIMSPKNQISSPNICSAANCSHICLPNGDQTDGYRCLCDDIPSEETCNNTHFTYASPQIPEQQQNSTVVSQLIQSREPLLLFSARKRDIRLAKVLSDKSQHYADSKFLYKLDNYLSALDYSLSGNYMVWLKVNSSLYSYMSRTSLYAAPIDPTAPNQLNLTGVTRMATLSHDLNLKTLAIDWVHNLLYYPVCESLSKGIFVANMSSPTITYKLVRLSHCVKDIRVDPNESLIFWNEYNEFSANSYSTNPYSYRSYSRYRSTQYSKSVLRKCYQSGNDIQNLTETQQSVVQKNSLTLDITEKRVYWIERNAYFTSSLYSMDYNGDSKTLIISSANLFDDFSSMEIFGKYIYWVHNEDDTIRRIAKQTAVVESGELVLQSGVDIDAIRIVDKDIQPNATNKCRDHNCPQICLPLATNYTCYCAIIGFMWNGTACVSDSRRPTTSAALSTTQAPTREPFDVLDSEPKLMFVVYKEGIYVKQNLNELQSNYLESIELKQNNDWITELDYNFADNYILWLESSVFDGFSLFVAPIDKNKPNALRIIGQKKIASKSYNSKRIAFDWIHKLVYLSVPKGIEAYTVETTSVFSYQVVTHDDVMGDIAVDPSEGHLIWSQWKYNAFNNQHSGSIMRANQDGSDQRVLTTASKIPNTLTIDLESKTIFWIDTSQYSLYSMDYQGNNARTLIQSRALFDGSFSMDLFGDNIFWSNYDKNSILMTDKSGANQSNVIVLVNAYTDLEGIRVLDGSRQKNGTNRCQKATCSQMCLPKQLSYRCVCSKIKVYGSVCTEPVSLCQFDLVAAMSTGMSKVRCD